MTQRTESLDGSIPDTVRRSAHAQVSSTEGLIAFTPLWGAAMLFSLAGDRNVLALRHGALLFALTWAAVALAIVLIVRPRFTTLLYALAGLMVARYALMLPVASNNKTIAVFMNAAIIACVLQAAWTGLRDAELRDITYERMRVVARALLAVMYFYGIFHKINIDFFDPRVSCAVALYDPLARGFGLDGNPIGHQVAIWSTFIVETITLIALYWKRFFAVGLVFGLMFHFVIPISTYSWYMDFSSLVLALYMLSIPREVSTAFFERIARIFRASRQRFGSVGLLLPFAAIGAAAALIVGIIAVRAERTGMLFQLYTSMWVLFWAIYGGIAMVLLTAVALDYLPWRGQHAPRQPLWLYAFPLVLFVSCLSPYVGLKTESSIAMFSNLHTEGGETNHWMFAKPPYLFDYQRDLVQIVASSSPTLQQIAARGDGMVWLSVQQYLRANPQQWITFRRDGVLHERATAAAIAHLPQPSWFERKLLVFKPVDFDRPKVCTH